MAETPIITEIRWALEEVEGHLNRLHNFMSPQLQMELEYQRSFHLKALLKEQILAFDTHTDTRHIQGSRR